MARGKRGVFRFFLFFYEKKRRAGERREKEKGKSRRPARPGVSVGEVFVWCMKQGMSVVVMCHSGEARLRAFFFASFHFIARQTSFPGEEIGCCSGRMLDCFGQGGACSVGKGRDSGLAASRSVPQKCGREVRGRAEKRCGKKIGVLRGICEAVSDLPLPSSGT